MRMAAFFTALMFVLIGAATVFAGPAPQKVVDLANSQLADLGADAEVVKAVKEANGENKILAQIQKLDAQWKADNAAGKTAPYMTELMQNGLAQRLNTFMAQHDFITEIFVTDNQGVNVAQTGGTDDYWQGDEAKFQQVFEKGILVSDVEQEDGKNISQVSVPVVDGEAHIGTMTIGVNVDQVQ